MATTKVGIYRSYYGPVPTDGSGHPLPKSEWPKKRPFSWVVRWFGSEGDRYSKSFKSRKEAERFAESRQQEVRQGKGDAPKPVSLKAFYDEHKQLMKGNVAAKTLHMQLATLKLLAGSIGWEQPIHRISAKDIERFRSDRHGAGLAAASVNRELRTLKRLFSLAVIRGYLVEGSNPCVAVPMIKVGRKRPPYCSPKDFQALANKSADAMWRAMLVVIYTAGLRLREALNLTWPDVDFAAGQVHVARRESDGFVQKWTPKDHEMRSIPLPKQAIDLLTRWQTLAPEKCPYVFMDHGRWEYYRQQVQSGTWRAGQDLTNNVLRRFQTICRRAGVGPYTVHDLRRSCITNWARELPIHVVQQLAGHSEIKTTQQFYLSVRPEDVNKAQQVQQALVGTVGASDDSTDQKLTNSGRKRVFPGRRAFAGDSQTAAE
jgi:integrase